jgi:hypothetical protein
MLLVLNVVYPSNRLNQWCDENNISVYQAAYCKRYGCEDHIFFLNAALQTNVSKKRKVFALFTDLSEAYDSIRHHKLWSKLYDIGLSSKFILNIQYIHQNAKAKVRTAFRHSNFFSLIISVFQGEALNLKLSAARHTT